MTDIITNILIGFGNFPFFAVIFTLPILVIPVLHYKKMNPVRIFLNYVFLLYMLCLIALVFFPLPDAAQMAKLSTYDVQLIPFQFVADIIRESPLVWNQPATYLPALYHTAILQVLFNVAMTIPFGMFLRYYYQCSTRKVVLATFILSVCIEITQLTGMFFLYHGSYRLCDVDDLMANTLGGFLGAIAIEKVFAFLPSIRKYDVDAAYLFKSLLNHVSSLVYRFLINWTR